MSITSPFGDEPDARCGVKILIKLSRTEIVLSAITSSLSFDFDAVVLDVNNFLKLEILVWQIILLNAVYCDLNCNLDSVCVGLIVKAK